MTAATAHTGTLQITTPSDREIVMTRVFNAPRHLVFKAYTKPELVRRWLGGGGAFGGWEFAVCEIDLRVGGTYRYVWHGPDGAKMGMGGTYTDIVPNERIVATEKFDDPWYEGEAVGTIEFEENDGQTTLKTTMRYASKEVRDAVLQSPMKEGVIVSYDALENVLATL